MKDKDKLPAKSRSDIPTQSLLEIELVRSRRRQMVFQYGRARGRQVLCVPHRILDLETVPETSPLLQYLIDLGLVDNLSFE